MFSYRLLIHASLKWACLMDLRGSRFSASGLTDAGGAKKLYVAHRVQRPIQNRASF
jgi:hypothetical protein